jgi:hypothetical protein
MTMKKLFTTIFILTICATTAMAQHAEEVEAVKDHFKDQSKKNIIKKFMKLEGATATAFWTLYDQYEAERMKFAAQQSATTVKYVENFNNMTNEIAMDLLDESRARRAEEVQLKTKYLRKIARATTPIIAVQFAEIDYYIDLVIDQKFSESLPFIGEDW